MGIPTFDLHATLRRFDREAEHGVYHTGRYRCRYTRWGTGPALVIVHGLVDQARSFAAMMSALAPNFTCIAYELTGNAGDGASLGHYRHADFVADLVALLDHFRLDEAAVFGSSFGSTITLQALIAEPKRLRRAVLQGGFARRPLRRFECTLAQWARYWPGCMKHVPGRSRMIDRLDKSAFVDASDEAFAFFKHSSGDCPIRSAARRALILDRLDLRSRLPLVTQPVLMIGGDRDAIVPRMYEEELLAGLPHAKRLEIPRCGHYPHFTHPLLMAKMIREFLATGF